MRRRRGGEEWRVALVAWEVEVHAHARGDEELVRDGVFVGGAVGAPEHAAIAEGGVPALGGEVVEDAGAVCELGYKLTGIPLSTSFIVLAITVLFQECCRSVEVRGVRGSVEQRMTLNELDSLEPVEDHPEHIIISLIAQAECVLAEVEGGQLAEVAVDDILVIAHFGNGGVGGKEAGDAGERCGNLGSHDCRGPVDGIGPYTMGDGEVVGLHRVQGFEQAGMICGDILGYFGLILQWSFYWPERLLS